MTARDLKYLLLGAAAMSLAWVVILAALGTMPDELDDVGPASVAVQMQEIAA